MSSSALAPVFSDTSSFGISIDNYENTIAVAETGGQTGLSFQGAIRVFTKDESTETYAQTERLLASDTAAGDNMAPWTRQWQTAWPFLQNGTSLQEQGSASSGAGAAYFS